MLCAQSIEQTPTDDASSLISARCLRITSSNLPRGMSPVMAHFDVRNAATSCLKLRDERKQRGYRVSVAIDRQRKWGAVSRSAGTTLLIRRSDLAIKALHAMDLRKYGEEQSST